MTWYFNDLSRDVVELFVIKGLERLKVFTKTGSTNDTQPSGRGGGVINKCLHGGLPFRTPSIDKWYPFRTPCLELCIPFNVLYREINHKNGMFSLLFKAMKFIC